MANLLVPVPAPRRAKIGDIVAIDQALLLGTAARRLGRSGSLFVVAKRGRGVRLIAIIDDARVRPRTIIAHGTPNAAPISSVGDLIEWPAEPRPLTAREAAQLRERAATIARAHPQPAAAPSSELVLRVANRVRLKARTRLAAVEQRQLAEIGRLYFGGTGAARIAGPRDIGDPMEHRALMHVARFGIFEGKQRRYDAWLYMGDSGAIFHAGTTRVVAEVIQGGLQCDDRSLSAPLKAALPRLWRLWPSA